MPSKNSRKIYTKNCYYHIYNRGVEKRTIFQDEQDYGVFLGYLKQYLLPKDTELLTKNLANPSTPWNEKDQILKLLRLNNFSEEIKLVAYCLMPNHFHFLLRQNSPNSIDIFMNSLATRYTLFFNKKYKRVGRLYQDVYKGVPVESDEQLLHLSRYIHKQSLNLQGQALQIQQPCSLPEYLGLRKTEWVLPEEILLFFSKTNPCMDYKSFIAEQEDLESIQNLLIEMD